MFPASTIRNSTGVSSKTPTSPSDHASPVRSYNCQPTETEIICQPATAAKRPTANARTKGWRRAA